MRMPAGWTDEDDYRLIKSGWATPTWEGLALVCRMDRHPACLICGESDEWRSLVVAGGVCSQCRGIKT